jgi:hypothetical protein
MSETKSMLMDFKFKANRNSKVEELLKGLTVFKLKELLH